MRLLATGDLHIAAGPRFHECQRVLNAVIDIAQDQRPDVILIPGDIYDAATTPDERNFAAHFVSGLANMAPVLICQGNHDRRRDLVILSKLKAKYPIAVQEAAGIHNFAGISAFEPTAVVAAVAWPSRASIAAMLGTPVVSETIDDTAREMLRNVFRGLGAQLAKGRGAKILMGHFMVNGSVTTSAQPLIGCELNIGLEDLALAGADIVIMGHIHQSSQAWDHEGVPTLYTGSPWRQSYGEPEEKSVLVAEFDGAQLASWSRIPTPAQPMLLLEGTYSDGRLAVDIPPDVATADIRLRYHVSDAERVAAALAAKDLRADLLSRGASVVTPEPIVEVATRCRAPEVARAATLEGQLKARWDRRGETAERQASQMARLERLKEMVA